jgi:hypothetical protein
MSSALCVCNVRVSNNYRWKYATLREMHKSISQILTSTQKLANVIILVSIPWNVVVSSNSNFVEKKIHSNRLKLNVSVANSLFPINNPILITIHTKLTQSERMLLRIFTNPFYGNSPYQDYQLSWRYLLAKQPLTRHHVSYWIYLYNVTTRVDVPIIPEPRVLIPHGYTPQGKGKH